MTISTERLAPFHKAPWIARMLKLYGGCPVGGVEHVIEVTTNRGVWRCRTCGAGGNVFGLVKEHEQCSFPEAVELMELRAKFTEER